MRRKLDAFDIVLALVIVFAFGLAIYTLGQANSPNKCQAGQPGDSIMLRCSPMNSDSPRLDALDRSAKNLKAAATTLQAAILSAEITLARQRMYDATTEAERREGDPVLASPISLPPLWRVGENGGPEKS